MRYIAYGLAILAAVLTVATSSYAQRVRMEPKFQEEKVPQRKVQPDGFRGPEQKEQKAIEPMRELDLPEPHTHIHQQHCQQGRDVECGGGGDLRELEEGAESK